MKLYTDIIAKYLNNELSAFDKAAFENELAKNSDLQKQLQIQKEIINGIRCSGLKKEINTSIKKVKINKVLKSISIGLITAAALVTAAVVIKENFLSKPKEYIEYALNENGNTNWSEADKNIESQFFKIDPAHDTIIETKSGIIFQIKANTFYDKFGEAEKNKIDLEIKEAMNAYDIIKAGLSTTSNGELLQTGGMFYINARNGEEVLDINQSKPIDVHVPSGPDKQMSLFDGERLKDGTINWINPKPMNYNVSTVDILKLDFYPPHFIDSLASMGFDVKNKALTDSIYYSFSNSSYCEGEFNLDHTISDTLRAATKTVAIDMKGVAVFEVADQNNDINGEKLFKMNCAVCHAAHSDQKLTGRGLKDVLKRVPSIEWMKRFILNSEKMIRDGDQYALKIFNESGKATMTVFEGQLSDEELNSIIHFITNKSTIRVEHLSSGCSYEINPSRIHAIWDPEFNNTLLATKQFEERLKVIFTTCNANILNLYIKNLGSKLYEIDSVAITMLSGEAKNKFMEFYKRRDGGVAISTEQTKKLQAYCQEKKRIYDRAVSDAMAKLHKDENEQLKHAESQRNEHASETNNRTSNLLMEEIEVNLDEAYRQLGKPRTPAVPNNFLSAQISTPGWKNVDAYVVESTVTRSTLDFTDRESGRKAVIEYKEANVNVIDADKYDRIVCYLLPDKLSSFQLMKKEKNRFTEKLNQTFAYSIITVGFKGQDVYYNDIQYAKAVDYNLTLEKADAEGLTRRINSRYNFKGTYDIIKDIDFNVFEQKEVKRLDIIKQRETFRNRLRQVVYPCWQQEPADDEFDVIKN